jgi:hypothetical protein
MEDQVDLLDVGLSHGFVEQRNFVLDAASVGSSRTIHYMLDKMPELLEARNNESLTPLMVAGKCCALKHILNHPMQQLMSRTRPRLPHQPAPKQFPQNAQCL